MELDENGNEIIVFTPEQIDWLENRAPSGTGDDPASSPEAIADNAELHARIMRRAEEWAKTRSV